LKKLNVAISEKCLREFWWIVKKKKSAAANCAGVLQFAINDDVGLTLKTKQDIQLVKKLGVRSTFLRVSFKNRKKELFPF
jgi:hypothetical protein